MACNGYSLYLSNLIGIYDVIDMFDLIDSGMSILILKRTRLTFSHFLLFLVSKEKIEEKIREKKKEPVAHRMKEN